MGETLTEIADNLGSMDHDFVSRRLAAQRAQNIENEKRAAALDLEARIKERKARTRRTVRRKRIGAGAAAVTLALFSGALAARAALRNEGECLYTTKEGDSAWVIAQKIRPNADPQPLSARILAKNGITDAGELPKDSPIKVPC